ncbi:MAG: MBL fold metallo-hydrolase [Acetobacteraceae bacterium]|nr:MBL fold metallo-hydrolase [Acetobacteraceae bacterium]
MLDVPGSPRIIHTPGHTPGSVAVHVPALDALFLGDTMTTRNVLTGVTGPKPAPFTLEPGQAVASLDRIEGVDATWLLPGHGPAWDGGAPEAVRLIREASAEPSRHRLPLDDPIGRLHRALLSTAGNLAVSRHWSFGAVGPRTQIHGSDVWLFMSRSVRHAYSQVTGASSYSSRTQTIWA